MYILLFYSTDIRHRHEEVPEQLNDSDLDQVISINLIETETIFLLDLPSICVFAESDEATRVREQNEKYHEVTKIIMKSLTFYLWVIVMSTSTPY